MSDPVLLVGEKVNAGFGYFVPVSTEDSAFGCDAHLGEGEAYEFGRDDPRRTSTVERGLFDWENGGGSKPLLGSNRATAAQVWAAVKSAGF